MGKYTGLKNKFDEKRKQLFSDRGKYLQIQKKENAIDEIGNIVRNKKILIGISQTDICMITIPPIRYKSESNAKYYKRLLEARNSFPECEKIFETIEEISAFDDEIASNKGLKLIDVGILVSKLKLLSVILQTPNIVLIRALEATAENYRNAYFINDSEGQKQFYMAMEMILNDICIQVINGTRTFIEEIFASIRLEKPNIDVSKSQRTIDLIDKYNRYFTEEKLLRNFSEKEEKEFQNLIDEVVEDEYERRAAGISLIQENYKDPIDISFRYIKMSSFTDEERQIIDEFREIILDDEFKDILKIIEPTIMSHMPDWNKAISIEETISAIDVLLEDDLKDITIKLLKLTTSAYKEYMLHKVRQDRIDELNRIIGTFNSIVLFIKKSLPNVLDQELNSNKNELELCLQEAIEIYLPYAKEVERSNDDDSYYEEELDSAIKKYMDIIKYWKNIMQEYYGDDVDSVNKVTKENTNNLVFLCSSYSSDYDEERRKELMNTIINLEIKSSHELKCPGGRKGMTRLRKTTRKGTQIDYVEYLEKNGRRKIHFVPYRYSSSADYRTALIKFNPSEVVKKHLEERYGLSPQCAIYAPILVIEAIGANHSEYSMFEGIFARLGATLFEDIALLFADENPDFEKLDSKVDEFLANKHAFLASATKEDETRK